MNDINRLLISLLTCAVRGESADAVFFASLGDEEIKKVYALAKKHDLAHLVGVALENAPPQVKQQFKQFFAESVKAMYRYEWLKGELEKICALLERNQIPYIPLKGSVIRALYREPWHRTSCDIDILIPKECLDKACFALETELSYTRGKISRHDVSMTAPNGVHFELHFDIDEIYVDCSEFWEDAKPAADGSCQYVLSAEMLILTHIAHMAKHFVNGGCGLKPFLDLWLLKDKLTYDPEKLQKLFQSHGLAEFSRASLGLVDVWLDGKQPNEIETVMESFVLSGGVYGSLDNKITVTRSKGKSKFGYAIERIFPPYSSLKVAYPILNSYPCLMPICWGRRWFRLLRAGKLKQIKTEYSINHRLNFEQLNNTDKMLKLLGLNM